LEPGGSVEPATHHTNPVLNTIPIHRRRRRPQVPFKTVAQEAKAAELRHKKRGEKIRKEYDTVKTAQARYLDQAADQVAPSPYS